MELYPTDRFSAGGLRIWETRTELDAHQTFALLNGGYWAPDVEAVLLRSDTFFGADPNLDPLSWNHYQVTVRNEDGTQITAPSLQRLTIQDGR